MKRGSLLAALAFLPACSLGPKYIAKDFSPPRAVAVLPFSNDTNDVTAPETVRKQLIRMLPERGYSPEDKERVDKILLERLGISDGGQLNSVTPAELGKVLNAEALFYGRVISFVDLPFGFGRKRTVKANLRLVDARTGNLLWEDEKGWTTPEIHLSAEEARKAAVRQVAERQVQKMTGTFLQQETVLMLRLALRNLPQR